MTWDETERRWQQLKGQVKTQWSKLTDDDFKNIAGSRERLITAIENRYGLEKARAEQRVESWLRRLGTLGPESAH